MDKSHGANQDFEEKKEAVNDSQKSHGKLFKEDEAHLTIPPLDPEALALVQKHDEICLIKRKLMEIEEEQHHNEAESTSTYSPSSLGSKSPSLDRLENDKGKKIITNL